MVKRYFFGILKCRYGPCSKRMDVSKESYQQNPFCSECLSERLVKAAADDPVVGLRDLGDGYVRPVRLSDLQKT